MIQPRLLDVAPAAFDTLDMDAGNELLTRWGHRLGELHRPFSSRCYTLLVDGEPVSLAMSASTVSATVAGYRRGEVVELARLCSAPGQAWASRVVIRVWREVFARRWPDWPVAAAISYSQNASAWTTPALTNRPSSASVWDPAGSLTIPACSGRPGTRGGSVGASSAQASACSSRLATGRATAAATTRATRPGRTWTTGRTRRKRGGGRPGGADA